MELIFKYVPLKIFSSVALCKLLQHGINTDDKRLQDIRVKGEEIFNMEEGIRTRSKAAKSKCYSFKIESARSKRHRKSIKICYNSHQNQWDLSATDRELKALKVMTCTSFSGLFKTNVQCKAYTDIRDLIVVEY